MAAPSDSPKKLLPSILAGLGALLLVAGILLPTFLVPRLSITPPLRRAWQQWKHLHHGHHRRHRL